MTLLVIGEAGNAVVPERRGDVAIAIGVFGDAVHDQKSGLRASRHHLVAGEACCGQGIEADSLWCIHGSDSTDSDAMILLFY